MQPLDKNYMLCEKLFAFNLLGLLFNILKRLGSFQIFLHPRDKRNS